ncbi:putative peptidoglycan binding protein [Shimia isoporae]|uniref:Putative peptidoglycan binding protein n=1 Tax=Shimia isoporae TaxID=647720 RepID=A0A4R1NNV9_9RHOB|nr:peptidoglycan-binding domain-containing protein [Shimia isoporae]TCL09509.1 putative peptidoglycan binding protein [Shimia isoporae]
MRLASVILLTGVAFGGAAQADMWGGFIDGAIDGAIIGGIIDGEDGAIDGAVIGGTIGAIDGAAREIDRERRYYEYRRWDRYRAQQPVQRPKPKSAVNLVYEVQLALRRLGYDPGPADGKAGPATGRAIAAYQRDHGLPQDNRITQNLLQHMRRMGG